MKEELTVGKHFKLAVRRQERVKLKNSKWEASNLPNIKLNLGKSILKLCII